MPAQDSVEDQLMRKMGYDEERVCEFCVNFQTKPLQSGELASSHPVGICTLNPPVQIEVSKVGICNHFSKLQLDVQLPE